MFDIQYCVWKSSPVGIVSSISINRSEVTHSTALDKYIKNVGAMNKTTAYEYYFRLTGFQDFVTDSYKTTLDNIITRINEGSEDPYEILSGYVSYLQTKCNISTLSLKMRVITAKNFLEYYGTNVISAAENGFPVFHMRAANLDNISRIKLTG